MKSILVLGLGTVLGVAGCNRDDARPATDRRDKVDININVPDANIKIKKDKGVDVIAPNTNIKVNP